MKKAEAIGTIARAQITLEELTKYELEKNELDLRGRGFQIGRLRELQVFLGKITDKEYGEISGREADVKLRTPQLF